MPQPKTDQNGRLQRRQGGQDLAELLTRMEPEMRRALPAHLSPERMMRVALTALRTTPRLRECTPVSFMASLMSSAQLGLEVNTPLGLAYLIPRKNRRQGTVEATLQIGYQGYIELARRSRILRSIYAHVVRAGDRFAYCYGLQPDLTHIPSEAPDREAKPITHAYAVAHLEGADPVFEVLPLSKIEARRARSASANDGPWVTDYEAMCCKTAVRALWRWLPKSAEIMVAMTADEASDAGRTVPADVLSPDAEDALARAGLHLPPAEEPLTVDSLAEATPAAAEPEPAPAPKKASPPAAQKAPAPKPAAKAPEPEPAAPEPEAAAPEPEPEPQDAQAAAARAALEEEAGLFDPPPPAEEPVLGEDGRPDLYAMLERIGVIQSRAMLLQWRKSNAPHIKKLSGSEQAQVADALERRRLEVQ